MRKAARAIVIHGGRLLVMHREKFGSSYDTLPGGNIRINETPVDALNRELAEETQLQLTNPRLVMIEHAGHPYGDQYHFLCDYVSGEPRILPGSEEDLINMMGKNLHMPVWVSLDELADRNFRTREVKEKILQYNAQGWPASPVEFSSQPVNP
jgi:ADP-ribose pyrophosphatase YjhB (NUDIX family)